MAGRRVRGNSAVAVAVAMVGVALLALLFAASEADGTCNVDRGTVLRQCASCSSGAPSQGCCDALRNADFGCLCSNYWNKLKNTPYASCAKAIPSACNLPNAKCQ
uniref:Protease inhibitor/seed storage/LTP family protein n=1 Tax=Zea mays TaxID=4577 RepID=B6ST99_MAIZE|nr:protease inhibitor/seed storage/LTP family protein [Zea mays]